MSVLAWPSDFLVRIAVPASLFTYANGRATTYAKCALNQWLVPQPRTLKLYFLFTDIISEEPETTIQEQQLIVIVLFIYLLSTLLVFVIPPRNDFQNCYKHRFGMLEPHFLVIRNTWCLETQIRGMRCTFQNRPTADILPPRLPLASSPVS
jgi:hypothetical protein